MKYIETILLLMVFCIPCYALDIYNQTPYSGGMSSSGTIVDNRSVCWNGTSGKWTKTCTTIGATAIVYNGISGSATRELSIDDVSSTVITNLGQGAGDVALTLPTEEEGLQALFTVGVTVAYKWGVKAPSGKTLTLIGASGTITEGSTDGYLRMTLAQKGQSFACWTFKTGESTYDWMCKAISIGTSTFEAN
jgi:hypothetical protein